MRKNAIIPVTTKIDITIPAIPPAPIPDFLPPSLAPFFDGVPLLPGVRFPLFLAGGVPGGGGGAGPEFHVFPSFLS